MGTVNAKTRGYKIVKSVTNQSRSARTRFEGETAQIISFSFFGGVFLGGFGRVITASQKNTESAASVCPDSAPIGGKAGGTKKIRKESPTTNLRGRSFFIGRVRRGVQSRVPLGFESRPRRSLYRGESQVEVFVIAEADFPAFVAAHSIVHAPGRDFAAPRGNRNALFHRSNELLGPQQRPRPTYGVNVIFRVELQLLLLLLLFLDQRRWTAADEQQPSGSASLRLRCPGC